MLAQMCTPTMPAGGRACGDTGHTGRTSGGRRPGAPGEQAPAPTGCAVPSGWWGLKHRTRGRRQAQWAGHSEGHVDPGGGLGNRCLGGGAGGFRSAVRGDLKPEAMGACSEGGSHRKPDKQPPNTQGRENPTPPASPRPAATLPLSVLVPFLPCPQAPGPQPPKGSATSFFQPRAVLTRTAIR